MSDQRRQRRHSIIAIVNIALAIGGLLLVVPSILLIQKIRAVHTNSSAEDSAVGLGLAGMDEGTRLRNAHEAFHVRLAQELHGAQSLSSAGARELAMKAMPELTGLSPESVERIFRDRSAYFASADWLTAIDRGLIALAAGDYDAALRLAAAGDGNPRDLATIEGTTALAKYRDGLGPEWQDRSLSAFARALELTSETDEPAAWAKVAVWVAAAQARRGAYAIAEPLMRRAVAVEEAVHGETMRLAPRLAEHAALLAGTRELPEAEALSLRAVAIAERLGESDTEAFADLLDILASIHQFAGRHAEAVPVWERALILTERLLGPDHHSVARRLGGLAESKAKLREYAEAEALYRRALVIEEQCFGVYHPTVANTLWRIADLLLDTARRDETEQIATRAAQIEAKLPPAGSLATGTRQFLRGSVLIGLDRHAEAVPAIRSALSIMENHFGPNHPNLKTLLESLAMGLSRMGNHDEAVAQLRRALEIHEAQPDLEPIRMAFTLRLLGDILTKAGAAEEAVGFYRRELAIIEAHHGPSHPKVATNLKSLGTLLFEGGYEVEGETLLRRALSIDQAELAPDDPALALRLFSFADLLAVAGRHTEAEAILRRGLAITEPRSATEPEMAVRGLTRIARLLTDSGRYAEAVPLAQRVVDLVGPALGEEHRNFAGALVVLGRAQLGAGETSKAITTADQALTIYRRDFNPRQWRIATALELRADSLISRGLPNDDLLAEESIAEALDTYRDADMAEYGRFAIALRSSASVKRAREDHSGAAEDLREAIRIDLELSLPPILNLADSHHQLALALTAANDPAAVAIAAQTAADHRARYEAQESHAATMIAANPDWPFRPAP